MAHSSTQVLPPNVNYDVRWHEGGIGRFSTSLLPLIAGEGRRIGGRLSLGSPQGALEMAARFTPLGVRGGLLFSPGFFPPFGWEHRTIATVHDLMYLDPTIASPLRVRYFRRVVIPQLRRCRLVLTVSAYSECEIRRTLGPKGPNVVNVGVGVDARLLDVVADSSGDVPQLLFMGGAKPNKNLAKTLEAVALVRRSREFELVVTGDVPESIVNSAPANTKFLGLVPDEELGALYAQSTALLMPSLDEGFGLPALESMVAGTPVIYGVRGALPDVVGEHGWPVDPTDVESISAAIVEALDEPIEIPLRERQLLVENHRWADVAERVHSAVAEVL